MLLWRQVGFILLLREIYVSLSALSVRFSGLFIEKAWDKRVQQIL